MDMTFPKAEWVKAQVSPEEWRVRVELAAAYRLVAMYKWDDLVFTHISARVPDSEHILINPYGLMFEEVTASSLVKIDLQGNKVMDSPYDINPPGLNIHSCIHEARPDVGCIVHLHTMNGIAVSAQKAGLLPISQQANFIWPSLRYHGYEGIALEQDERARLAGDLNDGTYLILHNHGLLTVGHNVATAFLNMHTLERACTIQVRAQAGGELIPISPEVLAISAQQREVATRGKGTEIAWPGLLLRLARHNPGWDA